MIILILGLNFQWKNYVHNHSSKERLTELTNINKMYKDIGDYALQKHWQDVPYSSDDVTDYLFFSSLKTGYYEQSGHLLNIMIEPMGNTPFLPISKKDAIMSMKKSKLVILTLGKYPDSSLPFNQSIASMRSALFDYAESHFDKLGDYSFQGQYYRVYVTV
jgi:hypothetical protein